LHLQKILFDNRFEKVISLASGLSNWFFNQIFNSM
jgi:hypothetical protein